MLEGIDFIQEHVVNAITEGELDESVDMYNKMTDSEKAIIDNFFEKINGASFKTLKKRGLVDLELESFWDYLKELNFDNLMEVGIVSIDDCQGLYFKMNNNEIIDKKELFSKNATKLFSVNINEIRENNKEKNNEELTILLFAQLVELVESI